MQQNPLAPLPNEVKTFGIFIILGGLSIYYRVSFCVYIARGQTTVQVWGCDDS